MSARGVFPVTRWSLIARLGDHPQETSDLIGLYANSIEAYLRHKLAGERPERIEDITQDVLTGLLTKPEVLLKASPGTGSRFRYYLMHLAWQTALNQLRMFRRRDFRSIDAEPDGGPALCEEITVPGPSSDQHMAMDRAWALSVLQEAFATAKAATATGQLETESLQVLQKHLLDGEGLREVAIDLGLSLATCSRRLAKARQFLQQAIIEHLCLAGEVREDESAAAACDHLLAVLHSQNGTA